MRTMEREAGRPPAGNGGVSALLAACAVIAAGVPTLGAQAPPLSTDRPDFTESPVVVGRGVVQFEAGFTRSGASDDAPAEVAAPELLVRAGVSRMVELRLGAPNRIFVRGSAPASEWDRTWYAGAKLQVTHDASTGVALVAGARFATGDATVDGGDDDLVPELRLVISRELRGIAIAAMSSLVRDHEATVFEQTAVVSTAVTGRSAAFAEYAGRYGGGGSAEHTLHTGLAWQLSDDLQVDLHGGRRLGDGGFTFVGAGLAVRLR